MSTSSAKLRDDPYHSQIFIHPVSLLGGPEQSLTFEQASRVAPEPSYMLMAKVSFTEDHKKPAKYTFGIYTVALQSVAFRKTRYDVCEPGTDDVGDKRFFEGWRRQQGLFPEIGKAVETHWKHLASHIYNQALKDVAELKNTVPSDSKQTPYSPSQQSGGVKIEDEE